MWGGFVYHYFFRGVGFYDKGWSGFGHRADCGLYGHLYEFYLSHECYTGGDHPAVGCVYTHLRGFQVIKENAATPTGFGALAA